MPFMALAPAREHHAGARGLAVPGLQGVIQPARRLGQAVRVEHHGAALAAGHHYMAHKCGFTLKTLTQALHAAGFATSAGKRRLRGLDLWVVASKGAMDEAALRELAGKVLPA